MPTLVFNEGGRGGVESKISTFCSGSLYRTLHSNSASNEMSSVQVSFHNELL